MFIDYRALIYLNICIAGVPIFRIKVQNNFVKIFEMCFTLNSLCNFIFEINIFWGFVFFLKWCPISPLLFRVGYYVLFTNQAI